MAWLRRHMLALTLLAVSPVLLAVAALLIRIERALIAQVMYDIEERRRAR
jgi:hypothetical protein